MNLGDHEARAGLRDVTLWEAAGLVAVGLAALSGCAAPSPALSAPDTGAVEVVEVLDTAELVGEEAVFEAPDLPHGLALQASEPAPTNILLIQVDTLRADHLPMYGYPRQTLPNLSRRPWRVVEGLVASSSWTGTTTATLLTGGDVLTHGVRHPLQDAEDPERVAGQVVDAPTGPTYAEHFNALGFDTALFSGNAFVSQISGISRGFSTELLEHTQHEQSNAQALAAEALSWLDARQSEAPFFMMVQPIDPHNPYTPMAEDRGIWANPDAMLFPVDGSERDQEIALDMIVRGSDAAARELLSRQLPGVYDEQLLGLDRGLESLLSGLSARGLLDQTLVVFVADHGEALFDTSKQLIGHSKSYAPEVLGVPFMMLHPAMGPGRVSCLAAQTDVLPTTLATLGLPQLEVPQGRPLQAGCRDHVTSSLSTDGGLLFISVRDEERMLQQSCEQEERVWFSLSDDPLAETPLSMDSFDLDDPLLRQLEGWLVAYEAIYGEGCAPKE